MTEEQKKWIYEIEKEIQGFSGGSNIKVYASISIVRVQHTKNNECYRLLSVHEKDSRELIRRRMISAFDEIWEERKRDYGTEQEQ